MKRDDLSSEDAYSENVIQPEVQNAHAADCCLRAAQLIGEAITLLQCSNYSGAEQIVWGLRPLAKQAKALGQVK